MVSGVTERMGSQYMGGVETAAGHCANDCKKVSVSQKPDNALSCLDAYIDAFQALPEGVREAEVNAQTHEATDITVKNGKIAGIQASSQTVLFIRVNKDRTGYMYTEDLTEDASQVLKRALDNSSCSDREEADRLNQERRLFARDEGEAQKDLNVLEQAAARMEKALLEEARIISQVHVSLKAETVAQRTVNSYGRDISFRFPLYLMRVTANGTDGKRKYSFSYLRTASNPENFNTAEYLENLEAGLETQMNPEPSFPSGEYQVVLDKAVVRNIFVTAWQLFSGVKYADGASALCGLLSSKVGGRMLNITDYPSHPSSGFVFLGDCEGTVGEPVKLIHRGVLEGLMTNRSSAAALGLKPTGNAGRRPLLSGNIATDILVTPRNLVIEPGESDIETLLEHMGEGIYITTSYDVFHTVNISSGDFCIPCKGVRIRNGKRAEHLSSLHISGNMRELLSRVEEVGRELYLSPMEDLENYGIGACDLRLSSCMVSGE